MTQNNGLAFADTNIWLYAFIRGQSAEKTPVAQAIISNRQFVISTQVISEVCINLIRKAAFSEPQVRELITAFFQKHTVILPNEEIILTASTLRERHGVAFWDSMLISTALSAGATQFYSEDMQHGQIFEGTLEIVNPFEKNASK